MTAKYTPGPWEVDGDWTAELRGADGSLIAKFVSPDKLADAYLSAAAFELFEAALQMVDDHQTSAQHHPNHVLVPLVAFEAMKSALVKATGGGDGR